MATSTPLLAPARKGHILQLVLVTVPLLIVLISFLVSAARRPNKSIYNLPDNYSANQMAQAQEETGVLIHLMDMMIVFLSLFFCWTCFAWYVALFIPKRRHFIGRYLAEGKTTIGDVIYDKSSSKCGRRFHDYGYAVYAHPSKPLVVRKRVRLYQPYTRERVAILLLPDRPLSGQPKVDIEIDLKAASKERDSTSFFMKMFAFCWMAFTIGGAAFVWYQMGRINDYMDNPSVARKGFFLTLVCGPLLAYALNGARFIWYRNWMVNRGALVEDNANARTIEGTCCLPAPSKDGSDVIPYSVFNGEDTSYQGTLPSHQMVDKGQTTTPRGGGKEVSSALSSEDQKSWVNLNSV